MGGTRGIGLTRVDTRRDVSWANSKVTASLNRHAIRYAPAYNGEGLLDRDVESRIYSHYGRYGYWQRPSERAVV